MIRARHIPIFHPRLVRERVALLPDGPGLFARHAKTIGVWLQHLKSGALDDTKEMSLHGGFLERIFGDVLGYRTMATARAGQWDLVAEKSLISGGSADGAIGSFARGSQTVVAPIELKGADQFLDHARGRALTPVQQGWDYANRAPESRWIIVSNFRETRLYAKSQGTGAYEAFLLELLGDEFSFLRFVALLGRDAVLGDASPSEAPLAHLLLASERTETEVTERLYNEYRGIQARLFEELRRSHSNRPAYELLTQSQKILDRVLFVAFAEDRQLLPPATLAKAFEHRDPYNPRPVWQNFLAVFQSIDKGNPGLGISAYNGGLFRDLEEIEHLEISDEICASFKALGDYDYSEEVSVDVLGHIFEQSISDLEQLRRDAVSEGSVPPPAVPARQKKPSMRQREGIFYTPSFVTNYLIRETLGHVIREAWEHSGIARASNKAARIAAWEGYQQELRDIRVLDPACGSGAFLIAAFDVLASEFERSNRVLAELRGNQTSLFDLTKTVLNENLFGIDKSAESVEITKLSLWLNTAEKGKRLTFLDCNIRQGNTVVSDRTVDPLAFDWSAVAGDRTHDYLDLEPPPGEDTATYDARWRAGFDVVIGNPPYVRQELLTVYKKHWKKTFVSVFDGAADLFVYFFERGIRQLKPGGRLGFIVSNKWLRGGYAEALRGRLSSDCTIESIVDFGHAPIFADADAFPCIITLRKQPPPAEHNVGVTLYPREELRKEFLATYVDAHRFKIPQRALAASGWTLERPEVRELMAKLKLRSISLREYVGRDPLYGIKTGHNKAFRMPTADKDRLCREDPRCSTLFAPLLSGRHLARWFPEWTDQWIVLLASSENHKWPWSNARDEHDAEGIFGSVYPSLLRHLKPMAAKLMSRSDRGRYWWELRSCSYYEAFEQLKLAWPDILWKADFCLVDRNICLDNTGYFLPMADEWVVACLNSPAMWHYLWNSAQHAKDEALRMFTEYVVGLPIATRPSSGRFEKNIASVIAATREDRAAMAATIDVLRIEHGIDKPGNSLSDFPSLDFDSFAKEVKKRRAKSAPRFTAAAITELRKLFDEVVPPILQRRGSILASEQRIAAEVHAAYGLDSDDLALLRETAPPRMPPGFG